MTIVDYVPFEGVSSNLAGRSIETDDDESHGYLEENIARAQKVTLVTRTESDKAV